MLRIVLALLILSSCSMGTIKSGGEEKYVYDSRSDYTPEDLKELAPKVITTSKRDPRVGKLDDLFGPKQKPLKRIGIVVFETSLQPTLGGLAGDDLVYLSEAGKQIFTENLLSIWNQSFPILAKDVDYVSINKIKKAKSLHQYGMEVSDYVKSNRSSLAPDDIFYVERGKRTPTVITLNARGMRDVSFLLVPAYELMGGPKWSEHNKHFLNDVVKELKLDAAIIVMSKISWTTAHKDKLSDDFIPEEMTLKVEASTLLPLSLYHERLEKIGQKEKTDVTLCYRTYESEIKIPVAISVPPMDRNFKTITNEIVNPSLKAYKDLSIMVMNRIIEDMKKTW